jgi:outer membrane protein assembly factor BamA
MNRSHLLPWVFCIALFSVSASAQKYIPKKITFSGTTANPAELLAVSGLKPGDSVDQAAIQAAAQKLIDTGLFSDVRFSFDGVALNYALRPAAAMEPVSYANFPWWDDWPLKQGDVYDAVLVSQFLVKYKNQLHSLDGWSATYKQFEHEDTHVVDLTVTFKQGGPLN